MTAMDKPHQTHVHPSFRDCFSEPALTKAARQMLWIMDHLLPIEIPGRKFSVVQEIEGETVKVSVARGAGCDHIHVLRPKPLTDDVASCEACEGVGYRDKQTLDICNDCYGLGYRTDSPPQAPL